MESAVCRSPSLSISLHPSLRPSLTLSSRPPLVLVRRAPLQEAAAAGQDGQPPSMEIIPPPTAAPGSTADRTAYLRDKLATEKKQVGKKGAPQGKGDGEGEAAEEFVGEEGGDAMIEMLSAFDDDSGDD